MDVNGIMLFSILIFAGAALYSSVGHGGASAYLAIMALFSFAPEVMKPTSLVLNMLVSGIASLKYYKSGNFSWKIFSPITF